MNRAREIIGADWAYERGIYGQEIGVAVVDTGIAEHIDFLSGGNRLAAFQDVIHHRERPYDDNSHGTHVAGIIGGNGAASNGIYMGVAPKCSLIGVKVLNYRGNGNITDVLEGLAWIMENRVRYNIRIVNISVGTTADKNSDEDSSLVQGVNEVWDSGIVVIVAAGNNGPKPGSISMPGISRKVITVGASDDDIAVELMGNTTVDYSGRGPTKACIKKPDVVAPGSNIISCNSTKNGLFCFKEQNKLFGMNRKERLGANYAVKSGTSMATPIVTGAIALLLSQYPELSNKEVKMKLKESCIDLGYSQSRQGWGLLSIPDLLS